MLLFHLSNDQRFKLTKLNTLEPKIKAYKVGVTDQTSSYSIQIQSTLPWTIFLIPTLPFWHTTSFQFDKTLAWINIANGQTVLR